MLSKCKLISKLTLLLSFTIQGCTTTETDSIERLRWQLPQGRKLTYDLQKSQITPSQDNALYDAPTGDHESQRLGFDALTDPSIYKSHFEKIEKQLAESSTQKAAFIKHQVTVEALKDQYLGTLHTWRVGTAGNGTVTDKLISMTYTVFDETGDIYGNHMERNHFNLGQQIYGTPPVAPEVGAHWQPSIQLIGANEGFVGAQSEKTGQSRIIKIWNDEKGDRIARTHTIIAEEVNGYRKSGAESIDRYQARGTLVVLKDFYVDRGYLKQMIGNTYLHFKGSLSGHAFQAKRISLKLVE